MAGIPGGEFLNFSLGYEQTWSVRIDLPAIGPEDRRVTVGTGWVDVRDGRRIEAVVAGQAFPIEFGRKSDERQARRALKDASGRLLKRIEVQSRDADDGGPTEAMLSFMRTMLPDSLEVGPTIVIDEKMLPQIGNFATTQHALDFARQKSVLNDGQATCMVVATPLLGSIESSSADALRMYVYLANRKRLACRVGGGRGAEYLVVEEIQDRPTAIPEARLIAVSQSPVFTVTEQNIRFADLSTFRPRPHPFLDAWLEYEMIANAAERGTFESRASMPLDYLEVVGQAAGDTWRVNLASPREAIERWIASDNFDLRRGVRVKGMVELHSLEAGDSHADPLAADVVAFAEDGNAGRTVATIRIRDGKAPFARGRLIAVEDAGDAAQRRRREEAITRLRTGAAACPQMLQYVSDPSSVTPVSPPKSEYEPRKGSPPLNDAQKGAIQRAVQQPSLFLVQGPPGTGKTSVIVELIHALRRRYRNRREEEGGPLRVLVTSVQNDAVLNAIEKLSGDEVQVYADFGSDRKNRHRVAQTRRFLVEATSIVARLKATVEGDARFISFLRLSDLGDRIRTLRHEVAARKVNEAVVAELVGLAATEEATELPPLLVQKLAAIESSMQRAIQADVEGRQHTSIVVPAAGSAAVTDVLARLSALPATTAPDAAKQVTQTVRSAADAWTLLLEAPVAHQALAKEWRTLAVKLGLALSDSVLADVVSSWQGLAERTKASLAAGLQDSGQPADEDHWAPVERDVVEWLGLAAGCVERAKSEVASGEPAVIFSWIRALRDEPRRLEKVFARHAPVSTATCQRSAAPRVGVNDGYDVVIVDEAARAGIDILIPMTLGRSVVLIGDQQQLPPHVDKLIAQQMEEGREVDLQRESFFEWLWARVPSENKIPLTMQYRMHEAIGQTISNVFYDGKLHSHWTHDLSRAKSRLPSFGIPVVDGGHEADGAFWGKATNHPLVWIDTSDVLADPTQRAIRRVAAWPCHETNRYEVAIIETLLKTVDAEAIAMLAEQMGGRKTIGIIAFYSEQRKLIEALVQQMGRPDIERTTDIGTVDSFQGKEYPLVILSAVRSNADASLGFMALPQRINVAMSRAQRQLIIIGDTATLAAPTRGTREPPPMRRVFEAMQQEVADGCRGIVIPSRMVHS
jgi:hypothetical protein